MEGCKENDFAAGQIILDHSNGSSGQNEGTGENIWVGVMPDGSGAMPDTCPALPRGQNGVNRLLLKQYKCATNVAFHAINAQMLVITCICLKSIERCFT